MSMARLSKVVNLAGSTVPKAVPEGLGLIFPMDTIGGHLLFQTRAHRLIPYHMPKQVQKFTADNLVYLADPWFPYFSPKLCSNQSLFYCINRCVLERNVCSVPKNSLDSFEAFTSKQWDSMSPGYFRKTFSRF